MTSFKQRWEITKNWQLIFPFLGVLGLLFSGYALGMVIIKPFFTDYSSTPFILSIFGITLILAFVFLKITLWLFNKLENRWEVSYRWELIAIFLVFAVTGSSAARLSDPIMNLIGLDRGTINDGLFWTLRILIVFPIYQLLLVGFGWLFGQFNFFWKFEKKMLSRLGFKRFIE